MPIEKQLLPDKKLEPWYDKVTWLFVSRNFKNDAKDIVAIRSHDRFGVSSWPQMFVFDGRDDRILMEMPRDLPGFLRGLARANRAYAERKPMRAPGADDPAARMKEVHQRTLQLEGLLAGQTKGPKGMTPGEEDLDLAQRDLQSKTQDIVVRIRALRLLSRARPSVVLEHAHDLLKVSNDPWRYEILTLLTKTSPKPGAGNPGTAGDLTKTLTDLYQQAGVQIPSRNPNVLRIRVAECLGARGDRQAIAALGPTARAASPRNGLTGVVIRAIATIGRRSGKEGKAEAIAVLCDALPSALEPASNASDKATAIATRRSLGVVRTTLKALTTLVDSKALPALPDSWTKKDREALSAALHEFTKSR